MCRLHLWFGHGLWSMCACTTRFSAAFQASSTAGNHLWPPSASPPAAFFLSMFTLYVRIFSCLVQCIVGPSSSLCSRLFHFYDLTLLTCRVRGCVGRRWAVCWAPQAFIPVIEHQQASYAEPLAKPFYLLPAKEHAQPKHAWWILSEATN